MSQRIIKYTLEDVIVELKNLFIYHKSLPNQINKRETDDFYRKLWCKYLTKSDYYDIVKIKNEIRIEIEKHDMLLDNYYSRVKLVSIIYFHSDPNEYGNIIKSYTRDEIAKIINKKCDVNYNVLPLPQMENGGNCLEKCYDMCYRSIFEKKITSSMRRVNQNHN